MTEPLRQDAAPTEALADPESAPSRSGLFRWQESQFPSDHDPNWALYSYNRERWWGGFPIDGAPAGVEDMFREHPWAIGPFTKHPGNPVLAPTPGAWDPGRYGGGVHNGAVLVRDNRFHYIYRGERPIEFPSRYNYVCDIGAAVSDDGVRFTKCPESPFFRVGEDFRYSYEDVNIASHDGTYYLFCNRWCWDCAEDAQVCGTFLAVSKDLRHWTKVGMVFPNARRIHRNGVVLQNPNNEAVRVNGRFVMYLNDGLIARSDDMVHWESHETEHRWLGGEGCFALADHDLDRPDDIILFTGGNHSGHFYAAGQVLFSKADPEKPLAYLPRPFLAADPRLKHENGFSAEPPHRCVSPYADCIFFNGLTRHNGQWWLYYGGSEYYTCLATAPVRRGLGFGV